MANTDYVYLEIAGIRADFDPTGQVPSVNYALEDEDDFETKKAAESLDVELPGTVTNDQIHNSMHDPSVVDNTPGQQFEGFKPCRYIAGGEEILIGKYLQLSVKKRNLRPQSYKGKIYGLNGDWVIDIKEKTLLDFINPNPHIYNEATIRASWLFDGRNINLDYVYAPARYRLPFGSGGDLGSDGIADDNNCLINDMRPALSIYWILFRGFKSLGYRIVSTFMDLDYYRRSVLPWTWGAFDFVDSSRWEGLKFLAIQNSDPEDPPYHDEDWWYNHNASFTGYPDLNMTVDPVERPGAFDNNGLFSYTGPGGSIENLMVWSYPATGPLVLGNVRVGFSITVSFKYFLNSDSGAQAHVFWYKNGVEVSNEPIFVKEAPALGTRTALDFRELFFEFDIEPGDYIGCRILVIVDKDLGAAQVALYAEQFQLDYVRLDDGSTVDLKGNYPKFKNYKWLDLLRGEIDTFDLSIQTDPVRKEVYIEPTHAYKIDGVVYPGYFNRKQLDWTMKVDHSADADLELFSDYEREMVFSFIDDPNDGGLKKIQERNQAVIGSSKYLLPARFKTDKKEKTNRFYSPLMHREHDAFKMVTGISPQLPCIVPENIANTSNPESENTYNPKRAYYKGLVTGVGGWRFNGYDEPTLPFMFAVNYKAGGEDDPVLSYADQEISGQIGEGLMKKFFLQRMAIIRYGRRYNEIYLRLENADVANFLHRESIIIDNLEYILTSIVNFNPIKDESTGCRMWLFTPKSQADLDASYPSITSLQSGDLADSFDVKYWPHLLLTSDI